MCPHCFEVLIHRAIAVVYGTAMQRPTSLWHPTSACLRLQEEVESIATLASASACLHARSSRTWHTCQLEGVGLSGSNVPGCSLHPLLTEVLLPLLRFSQKLPQCPPNFIFTQSSQITHGIRTECSTSSSWELEQYQPSAVYGCGEEMIMPVASAFRRMGDGLVSAFCFAAR